MDPYLLTIKYIFNKNNKKNTDASLNDFFSSGMSFPEFIAILFKVDKIPGITVSKNKFQTANNNMKALTYLGQRIPFFSSYQVNFIDGKNQQTLIQLILSRVYFKISRFDFQKKCNDFLKPFDKNISNFSEFLQGIGFMKLLSVISKGSIPSELKCPSNQIPDIIIQNLNALNIPVIIDKTAFLPTYQDFLMYQAIIIMDQSNNNNNNIPTQQAPNKPQIQNSDTNKEANSDKKSFQKMVSFYSNQISKSNDILETKNAQLEITPKYNTNTEVKSCSNNEIKLSETSSNSNISLSSKQFQSSEILNIPKSSYLNIINNFMEVNNKHGISYISDFEKGIILPQITELLFNCKIPNISENPIGAYDQLMNNMSALYFINQKDDSINPRSYNMTNEDDIKSLIRTLFSIFIINKDMCNQLKNDCNSILHRYNIHTNNLNADWDNGKNFVALLNFVSNKKVDFPPVQKLNIDVLKDLFVKANCISVIEEDSLFGNADEFVISYQIKLIFDEIKKRNLNFNEQSNEIPKANTTVQRSGSLHTNMIANKEEIFQKTQNVQRSESLHTKTNAQKAEPMQKNSIAQRAEFLQKNMIKNTIDQRSECMTKNTIDQRSECMTKNTIEQRAQSIQKDDNVNKTESLQQKTIPQKVDIPQKNENLNLLNNVKNEGGKAVPYKYNYQYVKESNPILRTLNAIGPNVGLHYNSLDDIINGMTLHILVQFLTNTSSIPGIKTAKGFEERNINSVLNFLREKSTVFKYSTFDFKKKDNIIWFATVLLKQFFLKENKSKMMQKAGEMMGEKIFIRDIKHIFTFGNGFYKIFGIFNHKNKNYYDEASVLDLFQKAKVPFVLDENSLSNINEDYICFQLKLIFDHYVPQSAYENSYNQSIPKAPINENKSNQHSVKNINANEKTKDSNSHIKEPKDYNGIFDKVKKASFFKLRKVSTETKISDINNNDTNTSNTNNDKNSQLIKKPNEKKIVDQKLYSDNDYTDKAIDEKLSNILKLQFNKCKAVKLDEQGEKDTPATDKFVWDKPFYVIRLFEYKSGQWVFNKTFWHQFLKDNNIKNTDVLYWVLLLPNCTKNIDPEKDMSYRLIKNISGSKRIDRRITNDTYVEMGFCGNIKDIQERFEIKCIPSKNEYLAIIQLRYPPTLQDNPTIINMQTLLSIQSDYILPTNLHMAVNESVKFINDILKKAKLSNYFTQKNAGISYLFTGFPFGTDQTHIDFSHSPDYTKGVADSLVDNEFFQQMTSRYSLTNTSTQWINITDYKTYNTFLEAIINYCQNNTNRQSMISNISKIIQHFYEVNGVKNEEHMKSFISALDNELLLNTKNYIKPLFKFEPENRKYEINFNKSIWDDFIQSNKIDDTCLYLVLFSFSDPKDVFKISKVISTSALTDIYTSKGLQAQIGYCGLIDNFVDHNYDSKDKSQKYHLAFINVQNSLENVNKSDLLFFETVIASRCNIIITILNERYIKDQLIHTEKMMNVLEIYSETNEVLQNIILSRKFEKSKELSISHMHMYVIFDDPNQQQLIQSMKNQIPKNENVFNLNIFHYYAFSALKLQMIKLIPQYENYSTLHEFETINAGNNPLYFLSLQNIRKITKEKENDDDENEHHISQYTISIQDESNTVSNLSAFFYNKVQNINSLATFHSYFIPLLIDLGEINDIVTIVNRIKNEMIANYVNFYIIDKFVDEVKYFDFTSLNVFDEVRNNIINSVTFVDDEFVEFNKNLIKEKINESIYNQLADFCKKLNIKDDLLSYMYELKLESIDNQVNEVINSIDPILHEIKEYKQEDIELNQEQIEQQSMRYILSVKESFKEMTVELTCDDDLEKEIPQDF